MKKLSIIFFLTVSFSFPAYGAAVEDYAGTYSGILSGDDNGEWITIVETDGDVRALFWSTVYKSMDGIERVSINSDGHVTGHSAVGNSKIDVDFYTDGNVSGTWYHDALTNGTLSGAIQTETSQYAGNYSGTISGDNSGTWSFIADSSGYISGLVKSSDGNYSIEGAVNSDGTLLVISDNVGFYGKISGNEVSGVWSDSYSPEYKGTALGSADNTEKNSGGSPEYKGAATGSVDNTEGSSGGGGCFIQSFK